MADLINCVQVGDGTIIEDGVMLGLLPKDVKEGELETIIGKNGHIRSGTYIYAGNHIGDNFQTGNKVNIRESNRIGNNVSIGTSSIIEHHVEIADNVRIHTGVFVPEETKLYEGAWLGPKVCITNAPYPLSKRVKEQLKGVILYEGAIVGANATLLPGVRIGKCAIVGSGSVVTKDVPDYHVVAGNPSRKLKMIQDLKDELGEFPYEEYLKKYASVQERVK